MGCTPSDGNGALKWMKMRIWYAVGLFRVISNCSNREIRSIGFRTRTRDERIITLCSSYLCIHAIQSAHY
jgi:hypothetical protein